MGENLGSNGKAELTSNNESNNNTSNPGIPIIAVTGTNGKTTTTRLSAYIVKQAGFKVGFTCSDGIYIDGLLEEKGDCSGPLSAGVVLNNKDINFAVLECARGGILRAGLAFEQCDVAVITNIAEDHLDLKGVNTLHIMTNKGAKKSIISQKSLRKHC